MKKTILSATILLASLASSIFAEKLLLPNTATEFAFVGYQGVAKGNSHNVLGAIQLNGFNGSTFVGGAYVFDNNGTETNEYTLDANHLVNASNPNYSKNLYTNPYSLKPVPVLECKSLYASFLKIC